MSPLYAFARHAAQRQQNKMQRYTDAKRGARTPSFRPGEKVRIRKAHHVPKAHPRFTPPATVRKRICSNSFFTEWWKNLECLSPRPLSLCGWTRLVTHLDCYTPMSIIAPLTNSHMLNTSLSGIRTMLCCNLHSYFHIYVHCLHI